MFGIDVLDKCPIEDVIRIARKRLCMGQSAAEVHEALVQMRLPSDIVHLAIVAAQLFDREPDDG